MATGPAAQARERAPMSDDSGALNEPPRPVIGFHAALRRFEPDWWRQYRAAAVIYGDEPSAGGARRLFDRWRRAFERIDDGE